MAHASHGDHEHGDHERTDVRVRPIVIFSIALVGLIVFALVANLALVHLFVGPRSAQQLPLRPEVNTGTRPFAGSPDPGCRKPRSRTCAHCAPRRRSS